MSVALSADIRYRVLHDPHESGVVTQQMNAADIVDREALRAPGVGGRTREHADRTVTGTGPTVSQGQMSKLAPPPIAQSAFTTS